MFGAPDLDAIRKKIAHAEAVQMPAAINFTVALVGVPFAALAHAREAGTILLVLAMGNGIHWLSARGEARAAQQRLDVFSK